MERNNSLLRLIPFAMMALISLLQILCFLTDEAIEKDSTLMFKGVTGRIFVYDPQKKIQVWRFLTYLLVHIGSIHLAINIGVQLFVGAITVAIEMYDRWWKILLVYFSGAIAGSLIFCVTYPTLYLTGASGGVCTILSAVIVYIIKNWDKDYTYCKYFTLLLCIAITIYYLSPIEEGPAYAVHWVGAIIGLLLDLLLSKLK